MKQWYSMDQEQLFKEFSTDLNGLSSSDAKKRLLKDGKNELPQKKSITIFEIIFSELCDPIVLLLIVAIVVSFFVGEKVDAIAITFIVFVDLVMGTYQENKANHTADALSKLVAMKSRVLRDQKEVIIDSKELVRGDIVFLESGDKISADMRILDAHNLTVDESVLTGESLQVQKNAENLEEALFLTDQNNMLFAGTTIVTGRVKALVVSTGIFTEIGKIAESIQNTKEEKSPLTIRIEKFSRQISLFILVIAFILTFLLLHKNVGYHELFLSVIALAVSAMPEGLPLALTMALTIASNKMAKKKVVAKKLHSIESLGSCTVIASDKTGTLTVNEQTAKKILLPNDLEYTITGVGYNYEGNVVGKHLSYAKELAFYGVINNEATMTKEECFGDSIDLAFLTLGKKLSIKTDNIHILEKIPYESENKYSAVFYEKDGDIYCTVKGSLEKIVSFCRDVQLFTGKDSFQKLERQNERLAGEGYRVIAIANGKVKKKDNYTEEDISQLTFMGMVGFIDPIRKEVISSIKQCRLAGIKVLMITGDHPLTAFAIAKDLKLTSDMNKVTTGRDVDIYLEKGEQEFDEFVRSKCVFTRVSPLQKLKIVESLKRQGEFVAVTGDGVNDAPALRSANIGVAMGSGTDIARETANMIIMDDNFKSIVAGILEGRVAYSNIRKIIYFLISCGFAEVLFFCLAIVCDMPMPLVAIQLLWLNVVTDGIQDFALSFECAEKNIMKEKPRNPKESLFDQVLFEEILLSGVTIGLLVFGVWWYFIHVLKMDILVARGYILVFMVFIQNVHTFNCRSEKQSTFDVPLSSNWLIVIGVGVSILLGFLVMEIDVFSKFLQTVSIPFSHMLGLFSLSLIILIVMELYKKIRFYRN